MALRLIRRGPETVRLDVAQGDGWQRVTRGVNDASSSPDMERITLSARGCDSLRVYDYDAPDQPYWESNTGENHSLTIIKTVRRAAVRVQNPTPETEVIMHVVPIPPPS